MKRNLSPPFFSPLLDFQPAHIKKGKGCFCIIIKLPPFWFITRVVSIKLPIQNLSYIILFFKSNINNIILGNFKPNYNKFTL